MPNLELDVATSDRLALVAGARGTTPALAVGFLLDQLSAKAVGQSRATPARLDEKVDVHVVYRNHRVEGVYDRTTQSVTITSDPWAGEIFKKPSPAMSAVVENVAPGISSSGNGWNFWVVTATGKLLQSIRFERP